MPPDLTPPDPTPPDLTPHTAIDFKRPSDTDSADRVGMLALAEARLEARAAEGDREAMDSVWRQNRRWLASVLAAHAPRGVEVEDLLQEVAATFVAKAREIRDAASVRGWLRVVAVNAARMSARRRAAERRSLEQLSLEQLARTERSSGWGTTGKGTSVKESDALDTRSELEARETLELLAQLPAQYAEPLLLQVGQGFSQREVAEILELPETTIETRLARARRMLRTLNAERDRVAMKRFERQECSAERERSAVIGHEQLRSSR